MATFFCCYIPDCDNQHHRKLWPQILGVNLSYSCHLIIKYILLLFNWKLEACLVVYGIQHQEAGWITHPMPCHSIFLDNVHPTASVCVLFCSYCCFCLPTSFITNSIKVTWNTLHKMLVNVIHVLPTPWFKPCWVILKIDQSSCFCNEQHSNIIPQLSPDQS